MLGAVLGWRGASNGPDFSYSSCLLQSLRHTFARYIFAV